MNMMLFLLLRLYAVLELEESLLTLMALCFQASHGKRLWFSNHVV